MRILMITSRFAPLVGGTETHVKEVADRLDLRGHTVQIITGNPGSRLPAVDFIGSTSVTRVKSWPSKRDWQFAPDLFRVIQKAECDLIHVQGCHTAFAPIAMLAAIRSKKPFVLSFHSGGHSSPVRRALRNLQWLLLAPLAKRARALIAVSDFEAGHFSRVLRLPRSRLSVVPNGSDFVATSRFLTATDANLILSVGRLEKYKGHQRAIKALPDILKRNPNAKLTIVGSGPYETTLRNLVRSLGLEASASIISIPSSDREALKTLFARAGVVVLLSDYEAHPVAIVEALSLGKSVVLTATSGLNAFRASSQVRYVPARADSRNIAETIVEAMENPTFAQPSSITTWNDCASAIEDIYRSLTPHLFQPRTAVREAS
jgi:glycogen synthase